MEGAAATRVRKKIPDFLTNYLNSVGEMLSHMILSDTTDSYTYLELKQQTPPLQNEFGEKH